MKGMRVMINTPTTFLAGFIIGAVMVGAYYQIVLRDMRANVLELRRKLLNLTRCPYDPRERCIIGSSCELCPLAEKASKIQGGK